MSSIGTLYGPSESSRIKLIRAVAALGGLSVEVDSNHQNYENNKNPEFLAKFPHGKIPAFEGRDGFRLFETSAIARYVATLSSNPILLGSTPQEAALINQWTSFVDTELTPNFFTALYLVKGWLTPYSKPMLTVHIDKLVHAVKTLETHISRRTFFVGERISFADLTVASALRIAYEHFIDAELRQKTPNLFRFYLTVSNQPQLKDIFGETIYCETATQYTPPAKEKKETRPTPVPAAPVPKAEKKPKAKEADDDEEDEPLAPEEPKAKNPLDSLPKSTLNLEDWKRAYSNKETRGPGGALEWFYENYDKEGYSLWRVDFKYNNELTQTFMSSNQIGGFFNRLEGSRKYLFGSVGVLGKANDSIITGALIARGQDIKPVVDVAPDWESYEYTRIDLNDEASKKFFEAALAWDLEIDGKSWVDGKNFK